MSAKKTKSGLVPECEVFLCAANDFLLLTLAREKIMLQNSRINAAGFYF